MSITAYQLYHLACDLREFMCEMVDKHIVVYYGDRKSKLTLGSTLRIDGQYYIVDRTGKEVIAMNYFDDGNGEQKVAAALNFINLYETHETTPSKLPTGEDVYWGQDMYIVVEKVGSCIDYDGLCLMSKYKPCGELIGKFVIGEGGTVAWVEMAFNEGCPS